MIPEKDAENGNSEIAKPDKKDYLALFIAMLQTVVLPFVLLLIVLVVLYVFLVIMW
jgi:hypothetical protein